MALFPDAGESFPFWGSPVYIATQDNAARFGVQAGELYCPGFVGSTYQDNPFDKVLLAIPAFSPIEQSATPGLATVSITKARAVDKKKAAGSDGARITLHGIDVAMVDIQLLIWTPQQYKMMREMWTALFAGPLKTSTTKTKTIVIEAPKTVVLFGGTNGQTVTLPPTTEKKTVTVTTPISKAVDAQHPLLTDHGVKSLIFYQGEGPSPGSVPRSRVFTMRAYEFLPPSKNNSTVTPVGSKATALDRKKQPTPGTDPRNRGPIE
jgi:hypothetical protein